jgi:chromosome segregation ATPase
MFFTPKKEPIRSEEYDSLLKKLSDVRHDLEQVKSELKALVTNYDNLRGQFNRKLSYIKQRDEEEESTKPEYLNTGIPFGRI